MDYSRYSLKPLVLDVAVAHREHMIEYAADGAVTLRHSELGSLTASADAVVPLDRQKPMVLNCLNDLGKALSSTSNSPVADGRASLRELYDREYAHYLELAAQAYAEGRWAPDYGTYVYDHVEGVLYTIATEFWHRLGLIASSGKLLADAEGALSWAEIRRRFDAAVIGVAGASVGGNVLEGAVREVRPRRMKLADPDWMEITNLNRLERGSIRHLGTNRARAANPRNPFALAQLRVNKAELLAYELHLVDPYASIWVYPEGLHSGNLNQFLRGDSGDEPGLDIFVEEMDHPRQKIETRSTCRELAIPVLMLSDFGHCVQVQFQDFRASPDTSLGLRADDEELRAAVNRAMSTGNRDDFFRFVRLLCGDDFATDEFATWVRGEGEQPTSSVPQSGATAMAAGGIGGKQLALYLLGERLDRRVTIDLRHKRISA